MGVVNDLYESAPGWDIAGGRHLYAQPLSSGGTVINLLKDVTASGFTQLTTLPTNGVFSGSGHASMVTDEKRQVIWIWGAETHESLGGMINTPFYFDIESGFINRMYTQSPWPGEYRIDTTGVCWADAAKTKPWAVHGFMRMGYDADTYEFWHCYDSNIHFDMNSEHEAQNLHVIIEGNVSRAERRAPIWFYNTQTGLWRFDDRGSTTTFTRANAFDGVVKVPNDGYYTIDQRYLFRLGFDGAYSTVDLLNKVNLGYQGTIDHIDGVIYKLGGNSNVSGALYSKHPIGNFINGSVKVNYSSFSALSGWDTANIKFVKMPDNRFLFLAFQATTGGYHFGVFILDVINDTVTDTGHRSPVFTYKQYEFNLTWSAKYNACVWIPYSNGITGKVYAIKV